MNVRELLELARQTNPLPREKYYPTWAYNFSTEDEDA